MELIKIADTSPNVTEGSRLEDWWEKNGYQEFFKKVRPKLNLPKSFNSNDPMFVAQKFNLAGIGFGNWLTAEDRLNYLRSLVTALYDLNKIMNMGYDLGFGLLTITFGARGSGGALAHYEPWSRYINITRYKDPFETFTGQVIRDKMIRFFATGGMGSLGHEYGHFIDYVFGAHVLAGKRVPSYALTGARSVAKYRYWKGSKDDLLNAMDDLMEVIIWKVPGKEQSTFYKRVIHNISVSKQGEYYIRRNELFARCFEAYISYELSRTGIVNHLLAQNKYRSTFYPTPFEIEKIAPKMREVISLMKQLRSE